MRRTLAARLPATHRPVFVDGTRIPFALSGTTYTDHMAVDLARLALKGLLVKTAIDPALLDYCVLGTVIQESRTSNLAREAVLAAGLPDTLAAHTVTMACISANAAVVAGAGAIAQGTARAVLVGGAETMSDVPIRYHREVRKRMLKSQKVKGVGGYLGLLAGLRLQHLAPELPAIAEFSTGEVMGHSADRLAAAWGVTREEQDALAYRSHTLAAAAHKAGHFKDEITPVEGNSWDNVIKAECVGRAGQGRGVHWQLGAPATPPPHHNAPPPLLTHPSPPHRPPPFTTHPKNSGQQLHGEAPLPQACLYQAPWHCDSRQCLLPH